MGLACSQYRLLTLTNRKADCEYDISISSMEKMALTREQSELSKVYYSKLKAKNISYYANGKYNQLNYNYLMGYGGTSPIDEKNPIKAENSMILTDYKGQVVLSNYYADAITIVLGSQVMDKNGAGGTFSSDKIPDIIAAMSGFPYSAEEIRQVMNSDDLNQSSYNANNMNTLTGNYTGKSTTVDNTDSVKSRIQALLDFYLPIFNAAAANGWTTEYNKEMARNSDYVNDAIVSGTFQLATVDDTGNYDPDTSLTYYLTNGWITENNSSEAREEVTAWYEAEKARISEKENYLDVTITDLSTELEAINTEIKSIESYIQDEMSVFEWGSG